LESPIAMLPDLLISSLTGVYRWHHQLTKIADGNCFGMTRLESGLWAVADRATCLLWIYDPSSNRIVDKIPDVISPDTHQIDVIDGKLFVLHTEFNRIRVFHIKDFSIETDLYPNGPGEKCPPQLLKKSNFCQFNSVYGHNGVIYLLAHNLGDYTEKNSELFVLDQQSYAVVEKIALNYQNCHNLAIYNGQQYVCLSKDGQVARDGEVLVTVAERFTRGLSISDEWLVFGTTIASSNRDLRNSGKVYLCNLDGICQNVVSIDGCVNDIRQISGDYGLSEHR